MPENNNGNNNAVAPPKKNNEKPGGTVAENPSPGDEYDGKYKDRAEGMTEAELWGTDQIPVKHDPLPAKNLKSVGG